MDDQPIIAPIKFNKPGLLEKSGLFLQLFMLGSMVITGWIIFSSLSIGMALWFFRVPDFQTLQNIVSNPGVNLAGNRDYLNALKFMQLINQIGMMGLPALVFGWMMGKNNDFLNTKSRIQVWFFLCGIGLVVVINPFIGWLGDLNQRLWLPHFLKPLEDWMRSSESANEKLTHIFTRMNTIRDLFINLIVIGIAAGLCEELLFRGVMQNLILKYSRNPHIAIWVAAIVFSAIHIQFYGFVPRMVLGAMLGYMFYYTGSLWVNASMHAFHNGIQVLMLYLYQNRVISFNIDGDNSTPSILLSLLSVSISLIVILLVRQQSVKKVLL